VVAATPVAALRTVIVAALAVDSAAEAASMVEVAAAVSTVEAVAATAVVDTGNSGLVIPGRSFRLTAED